jgi:hypothetical protein
VNKCSPLATIVIVNYNYDAFVAAAIDSALAQSYAPVEVIVVCEGGVRSLKQLHHMFMRDVLREGSEHAFAGSLPLLSRPHQIAPVVTAHIPGCASDPDRQGHGFDGLP